MLAIEVLSLCLGFIILRVCVPVLVVNTLSASKFSKDYKTGIATIVGGWRNANIYEPYEGSLHPVIEFYNEYTCKVVRHECINDGIPLSDVGTQVSIDYTKTSVRLSGYKSNNKVFLTLTIIGASLMCLVGSIALVLGVVFE